MPSKDLNQTAHISFTVQMKNRVPSEDFDQTNAQADLCQGGRTRVNQAVQMCDLCLCWANMQSCRKFCAPLISVLIKSNLTQLITLKAIIPGEKSIRVSFSLT